MEREMIIVLDFGGQYNQLIARRVRECNVYCEVHPYTMSLEKIKKLTGLDLREFDDAIIFKVAMMVKKYLNNSQNRY